MGWVVYTDTEEKRLGAEWLQMENGQVIRQINDGWVGVTGREQGEMQTSELLEFVGGKCNPVGVCKVLSMEAGG